jgi:acetoin utilization protein AcuB
MIARELITNDVPPIRSSETVEKALNWLDEFKVTHLAVVDGTQYQGLISEDILYDAASSDMTIAELNLTLNRPFIYEDRHIYEVMKMVSEMQLSIAPILDKSDNYMGLTTLPSLMHLISNTSSISEPGSVIVLELNQNDYSLGHLAQIIEGDDTKILSTYITSAVDSTLMEVTIKVNRKNIQGVLQALARYDYVVNASYSEIDYQEDMKDRFESLMKYLDM